MHGWLDVQSLARRAWSVPSLFQPPIPSPLTTCHHPLLHSLLTPRPSLHSQPQDASEAVDRAFAALRLLHDDYGNVIARMRALRGDRADRSGVTWPLGTVFAHARHGYRGVVFGWDRECERDAEWAAAMGVAPRQPFYHVLPDEGDCVRLFGGVRASKYVAQDNVVPLAGARVTHRALDNYFDGHDAGTGRYIPSRKLQFEYPDDYRAERPRPVGLDSNLLAHEEWEAGPLGAQRPPTS